MTIREELLQLVKVVARKLELIIESLSPPNLTPTYQGNDPRYDWEYDS